LRVAKIGRTSRRFKVNTQAAGAIRTTGVQQKYSGAPGQSDAGKSYAEILQFVKIGEEISVDFPIDIRQLGE